MDKEKKEQRAKQKAYNKMLMQEVEYRNQKPVKELNISIEWKKSKMWGYNPVTSGSVEFQDGTFQQIPAFKCSGCGYDKESTVIADVFNHYLKYRLYEIYDKLKAINSNFRLNTAPYGISSYFDDYGFIHVYYDGGIGISCYDSISKYIGGKFSKLASGNSFNVYKFEMEVKQ